MALSGNRGEWSEIYALFKLLGDKTLYAGDADLNKIEKLFYPIIKILRTEYSGNLEYVVNGDLIIINGSGQSIKIPIEKFKTQAVNLLQEIKKKRKGTFSLPEVEEFMNSIKCKTLKAKSSVKTDIRIVIHDLRTGMTPELGFSIKSQLGGNSTLLNASSHTNFVYESNAIIDKDIQSAFNAAKKFKDKFDLLKKKGVSFDFVDTQSEVFNANLTLIDSRLSEIIAALVYYYYSEEANSVPELCAFLSKYNPLCFSSKNHHKFYEYKLKKFLVEIALGMMPSKEWSGKYDATGGYLVVKEDGEVLCYHIYNRNDFEDYLFNNTRLDTPSTSRHDFGAIYNSKGKQQIKLNLQIRFN